MIEQGLVTADPEQLSLERVEQIRELAFLPVSKAASGGSF